MQTRRQRPVAPGQGRTQQRILDPQDGRVGAGGHSLAPWRGRASAPDANPVVGSGLTKTDIPTGERRQDAPDALLCQKAA